MSRSSDDPESAVPLALNYASPHIESKSEWNDAINSLVAGGMFFIPVITGIFAIILGWSVFKAKGSTAQKAVALVGIIFGTFNLLFWLFLSIIALFSFLRH